MYEKSQATIAHILDAAQASFVAHSYDDITMTAIAREANVTKGAIYHHFSSKEELFLAMMSRYLSGLEALLGQAVAMEASAYVRLTRLTALFLQQPLPEQRVMQLVRRDANRFAGATRDQLIRAYQAALSNQIEVIIGDGIAAGEIGAGNMRLLAWQYVAIVEVCLSDYARQQFADPEAMARSLTTLFFNGVGQPAPITE